MLARIFLTLFNSFFCSCRKCGNIYCSKCCFQKVSALDINISRSDSQSPDRKPRSFLVCCDCYKLYGKDGKFFNRFFHFANRALHLYVASFLLPKDFGRLSLLNSRWHSIRVSFGRCTWRPFAQIINANHLNIQIEEPLHGNTYFGCHYQDFYIEAICLWTILGIEILILLRWFNCIDCSTLMWYYHACIFKVSAVLFRKVRLTYRLQRLQLIQYWIESRKVEEQRLTLQIQQSRLKMGLVIFAFKYWHVLVDERCFAGAKFRNETWLIIHLTSVCHSHSGDFKIYFRCIVESDSQQFTLQACRWGNYRYFDKIVAKISK